MNRSRSAVLGCLIVGIASLSLAAKDDDRNRDRRRPTTPPPVGALQRGEYLVNHVARCIDCHTPRTENGTLDRARLLQGAPLYFKPAIPTDDWADRAPDITARGKAGKWSEDKMVKLLTQGEREEHPPMPAFRMTIDDAKAVYAYLRSLPRTP